MRPPVRRTVTVALAAAAACLVPTGGAQAAQSGNAGPNNDISDVAGVLVGNVTAPGATTGTTVVYLPGRATAGVDVRSGAPITRETDLTAPTNEVQKVNAVLLTGGGDYGLAAGPGVMQWLEEHDQGFPVGASPDQVVPIVPGAAINDLGHGHFTTRPDNSYGYDAIAKATGGPVPQGNVGAGAGAVAGGFKGGIGSASIEVQPGIVVGALVVVNSVGSPADTTSGCGLLGAEYGLAGEFADYHRPSGCAGYHPPAPPTSGPPVDRGGVIGVVATNVTLDKAMDQKLAQAGQDGVTRAVDPAHTMLDGDTVFGLSTDLVTPAVGALPDCIHAEPGLGSLGCTLLWNQVLAAAQDVVTRAVAHAVLAAKSTSTARSYCDRFHACGATAGAAGGGLGAGRATPPLGLAALLGLAGVGFAGRRRLTRARQARPVEGRS